MHPTLRVTRLVVPALLPLALGCGSSTNGTTPNQADAAMEASGHPTPPHHDAGAVRDTGASRDAASHDAGAADAPADVDNGAPSSIYPAPHPPLPLLTNLQGGPVLTTPKVYLVYYPGYPYITDLQTFATNMTTATYWGASTVQYGVGALTVGGAIELTGQTPPSTISQAEIGAWVATELTSGAFGTPDPEGIYTLLYPSTTTITQPNPILATLGTLASCVAFGGYHDDVAVAFTDGGTATNFAYAVIPTCDTSVNDLTSVISHEWVEASTDPFVTASPTGAYSLFGGPDSAFFTVDADHAIWALLGGGEAGDLCEPEGNDAYVTPADVGYTVQRTWSNLLAKGSHDPCQPDPANTPFFAGAPVLTETETLDSSLRDERDDRGGPLQRRRHERALDGLCAGRHLRVLRQLRPRAVPGLRVGSHGGGQRGEAPPDDHRDARVDPGRHPRVLDHLDAGDSPVGVARPGPGVRSEK
jgi:hypothetical protein